MIFKQAPADFKKEFDVVACYLEHDGEFVLLHRHPQSRSGNKWGLPAGKVDAGESVEEAMLREIREETGLDVAVKELEFIDMVSVRTPGLDFDYYMYVCRLDTRPSVVIDPAEHQGFVWVTPAAALGMDLIHDLDECIRLYYRD